MSNQAGQDRFMRLVYEYVAAQIREMKRDHRNVESSSTEPVAFPLTVEQILTRTTHLRISLLECQARCDGDLGDYLALRDAQEAVEEYTRDIFLDVTFSRLTGDLSDGPEPDVELANIITIASQLIDGLSATIA